MIGNIIAAIFIGIIAGYLGRALLPGDDSMGFVATVITGIVGALVGFFLFTFLLGLYRAFVRKDEPRGTAGPAV